MEQTAFMAKMKIYETFKAGNITEEQTNYFIDLIESALIKKQILENYISNSTSDAMEIIYKDCQEKAMEKGFGQYPIAIKLEDGETVSKSDKRYYESDEFKSIKAQHSLKSFAIYISKTTAVHNHKSYILEDIIGEKVEFPVEDLENAKGRKLLEEKFILLDYLKTHMDENLEYQKAFNALHKDIQFSCKTM